MLRDRIEDLARMIYPDGHRFGREWRVGRKGSVSVVLTGSRAGLWSDFEAGLHGDAMEMVAHGLFGGDKRAAFAWARDWLGVDTLTPEEHERAKKKIEANRRRARDRERAERRRREKVAGGMWFGAQPSIVGTPAERYLAGRAIAVGEFPKYPGALRWQPRAWCKARQARGEDGKYPAMFSALWRPGESRPAAVHRTFLDIRADGSVGKAPIEAPRTVYGPWDGALLPVQRGLREDGRVAPPLRDMEEGEVVAFGEGLEEGLSIALVKPEWRVFAVAFVGNFQHIRLPRWAHIMLCGNNDPAQSQAAKALEAAADILDQAGHAVRILRPPRHYKDWNDYLMGAGDGERHHARGGAR